MQNSGIGIGVSSITNSYRYANITVNSIPIPANYTGSEHDKKYGGVKTADELMTQGTYSDNGWLFNDSSPTSGPWHWDDRGFPKLNIGVEDFPFNFTSK